MKRRSLGYAASITLLFLGVACSEDPGGSGSGSPSSAVTSGTLTSGSGGSSTAAGATSSGSTVDGGMASGAGGSTNGTTTLGTTATATTSSGPSGAGGSTSGMGTTSTSTSSTTAGGTASGDSTSGMGTTSTSAGGSGGMGGITDGTSSTGQGGTGGQSGAFNPCPTNGDPCKILPLGDSITHGYGSSDDGGYRTHLYELIVGAQQKATFTGSLSNGPAQVAGQNFPKSHEGHDGWTIDPGYSTFGAGGISTLVPSPAFDADPNIVLLMIGTNDVGFDDPEGMPSRLEALLDKIVQTAPDALIVLAKLTPLGYSSSPLTSYNAQIPGIIEDRAAMGQHIIGVDMSQMPMNDIASDNVHPNDQGYDYMAEIWYDAIKDLLPD